MSGGSIMAGVYPRRSLAGCGIDVFATSAVSAGRWKW
jgi:hypothetical protein